MDERFGKAIARTIDDLRKHDVEPLSSPRSK